MILITGGAGYIGSQAVIKFLENGHDVLIFDNLENGHIETVKGLQKIGNVKFEKGDLKILRVLTKFVQSIKVWEL